MEEADARLQEVVASLLNEHGGNHEQALRQTFACLHNSGLYEAQSAAEEEQREQQVLAVFRSFPFRAPAVPAGDLGGAGNLVEETQAPPPAYNTLTREPEEAGEVTAAQTDPENVGEDARAQPAPEALLPLNPVEAAQEEDQQAPAPPGPEEGDQDQDHQGSAPPVPPSLPEQPPADGGASATPESFASAGLETGDGAAAADTASGGGVEETKGGEWGDEAVGGGAENGGASGAGEPGGHDQEDNNGAGLIGGGEEAAEGREELAYGAQANPAVDPESTRHQGSAVPVPVLEPPHVNVNGGGAFHSQAAAAAAPVLPGIEKREMDSGASPIDAAGGAAAAAAAAPTMTAVTEPHLKTGGQPLTHGNRAESPTGMSTDLQDKLKALKLRRKHRFVTMRIEGTEVVAETVAAPGEGPAELRVALPYSDCRYAVYDQEIVTTDGRKANKLFFFTWLPHNATPHNKMAYSHGKVTVRQRLEGLYDVAASSFGDIEVALGLVDEDEEDSDIDF